MMDFRRSSEVGLSQKTMQVAADHTTTAAMAEVAATDVVDMEEVVVAVSGVVVAMAGVVAGGEQTYKRR